jgi:bifunctional non-homologous end joining protein LigD
MSTPVTWEELPTIRGGNQYRVDNPTARLPNLISDPWPDFETVDQVVPVSKRRRS